MSKIRRSIVAVFLVHTEHSLKIALQRHGEKEDYPGACRVTVYGECQEDEPFFATLIRKMQEDFGNRFTNYCNRRADFRIDSQMRIGDEEIMIYYLFAREKCLKLIQLKEDSGGIELIEIEKFYDDSLIKITPDRQKIGYPAMNVAMFGSEIQLIKGILKKKPERKRK